jgi:hypothetical protein
VTDEHEWVRRLLAEAGSGDEPMPPHVINRLEATLARLEPQRAERATEGAGHETGHEADDQVGQVVPMTARRHRRWGAALLAAAAITVGGYSLVATGVLDRGASGASGADSADSAAGGDTALADEEPGGATAESAEGPGGVESPPGVEGPLAATTDIPVWSSATLPRDAAELVQGTRAALRDEGLTPDQGTPEQSAPGLTTEDLAASRDRACLPPPPAGGGTRHPVTYDGEPATAVVREGTTGASVVEVWSCEAPTRLGRVVVPGGR